MTHGGVVAIRTCDIKDDAKQLRWSELRSIASGAAPWLGISAASILLILSRWLDAAEIATLAILVAAVTVWYSGRALTRAGQLTEIAHQSIRIERATAVASRALLKRDVADPVGTSLAGLIDAVEVEAVFLETNMQESPDEHGNLITVRDILHAGRGDGPGGWELTGWRVGPAAQAALGAGLDHTTEISRLDAMTLAYYRAMEIRSEVLLPIVVEGRWLGSVGFISAERDRVWSEQERRLLRFTAEMVGAYWERRDAQYALEELLAAKNEFIASVSHEIRTPLTAVVGFASELDEHFDSFSEEERADLTSLMASQSREVADIVEDLLTAARADAGTIVIEPETVSVHRVVGEALSMHPGKVELIMKDDLQVWADSGRVRQVLRNLLTNADRYGGDTVAIHARRSEKGMIQIEVRDNGDGVPPHMRDRVFEPYGRAASASTHVASVGLGLSVARRLATMMKGRLELSDEGGWTVFTLYLPETVMSEHAVG
jgi:signal transduction histidine kinase